METNKIFQETQTIESEATMSGFSLSRSLAKEVEGVVPRVWESEDAVEIPNSGGQMLVREGSEACVERRKNPKILMIPYKITVTKGGVRAVKDFYVCTK